MWTRRVSEATLQSVGDVPDHPCLSRTWPRRSRVNRLSESGAGWPGGRVALGVLRAPPAARGRGRSVPTGLSRSVTL